MAEETRDFFGFISPGPPPPDEILEISKKCSDGLREQCLSLSQVLREVVQIAVGIDENKEFGCERCSECTIKISRVIEKWLAESACKNPDIIILQLKQFVGFPRALFHLIKGCLEAARNSKKAHEDVAYELINLCGHGISAYGDSHFLTFSRIASIFELLKENIEDVYKVTPYWKGKRGLGKGMADLRRYTQNVIDCIDNKFFCQESWKNYMPREKRICGGGLILPSTSQDRPIPPPIHVVDFSKHHVLGVVKDMVENIQSDWSFSPCQRELPFKLKFFPFSRDDGLRFHSVDTNGPLTACGQYYQLFKIDSVEPQYYYYSLCAWSTTNHKAGHDTRLMDTYNWPEKRAHANAV
jgi:hypothetical protein